MILKKLVTWVWQATMLTAMALCMAMVLVCLCVPLYLTAITYHFFGKDQFNI